ncbi:hypothetical protein BBJ28_00016857 [Nothophytophthora sp. Chile5]|nr:hypothetical protein BBJ28_00016857 [Nothophytophthora sp. Chile5]
MTSPNPQGSQLHRRLLLLSTLSGLCFLYASLFTPAFELRHLHASIFPSSTFQVRQGFVSVLRWLENLHSREDLLVLGQLLTQARLQARLSGDSEPDFATQVATAASEDLLLQLSTFGLQVGLVLFLYRRQRLTKHGAVPTMCLCVLRLFCWKMAQTCVHELLTPYRSAPLTTDPAASPRTPAFASTDATASFLNALFLVRYSAMAVVNVVLGRGYQLYFCDAWPTQWKRIPAYLGSKNLVLTTLFFTAAGVSAISVSAPALRCLCEAAAHIEMLALASAFIHFVALHFFPTSKHEEPEVPAKGS